ncbi:MAG: DEAD/DEAH box helicase [Gordonia sp. (in: high G+C Gram-positive bacteria)]|uniref:DEAD/DEAH box helicase n=1 Tax=Gordonia sp. (in: high G+C Gram-positive bacteria) TaxID=84139 RepID=UPI003BB5778D
MPVRPHSGPPDLGLRAVWRPGLGLALWPNGVVVTAGETPPLGELVRLPESVSDLLARRRLRHTVERVGPGGARTLHRAVVLGVPTTVELLDRCEHLSVGGELSFYRYLLAGARSLRDAGAVAPGVPNTGDEPALAWLPLPTPAWRGWQAVITASAPPALVGDDPTGRTGSAALFDFVGEVLDAECRRALTSERGRSRIPLIDGLTAAAPVPMNPESGTQRPGAGLAATWQAWLDTGTPDGPSLVLRLHQPDDDSSNDTRLDGGAPASAGDESGSDRAADRWRLQVCRRLPTGEIEPAVPHRLNAHDLDELTNELALAVHACGELSRAETDPHTLDFLLNTEQVAAFFADGAAAIGAAGVTVLLPRTVAVVSPTLALRGTEVPGGGARPGLVGLDEISDFEWRLALGDGSAPLSQDDLDELARQHGDLVRVRGRWVRAEQAALTRAANFLIAAQAAKQSGDQGTALEMAELMRLITDSDDRLPVPVTSVEGLGWLDDVATGGTLRPGPVDPPAALHAELRPYQQRGLEWLHALSVIGAGGVLADDMGLGKTVQVIALLTLRRADHPTTAPALVVCPMSVIGNWQRELERFAPDLTVVVHHGPNRDPNQLSCAATDVVVTTFATLTRDRDQFTAATWDVLVVDEAQHVKNVRTAAAKSLRALRVRRRFALTGTPVENRLEDLRAVIDLVNPGLLGSASSFRSKFAEPIERERDPRALQRLNALTRPFILRRLKTDPAIADELPEKTELTVRTNLTEEQAGLYQAILNDLHEALTDARQHGQRRKTVLAALTRLKQVCNHPAHYLGDGSPMLRKGRHRSGKVELLSDIATTLVDEGDRALIFTQFAAFGELLSEWLTPMLGREIRLLHGGLARGERDQLVTDFAADGGPPIMVATLKAGGTGLNLVAANHVIHADRWWNPAVEEQATDRAYRIGQTRAVQVRKFVCVGTLEERIDELIAAKRELSSLTVATGESWLSDLGDDALFDLLALRDEAVGE